MPKYAWIYRGVYKVEVVNQEWFSSDYEFKNGYPNAVSVECNIITAQEKVKKLNQESNNEKDN